MYYYADWPKKLKNNFVVNKNIKRRDNDGDSSDDSIIECNVSKLVSTN